MHETLGLGLCNAQKVLECFRSSNFALGMFNLYHAVFRRLYPRYLASGTQQLFVRL